MALLAFMGRDIRSVDENAVQGAIMIANGLRNLEIMASAFKVKK